MTITTERSITLRYTGPIVSVNEWKQPRRGGGMMLSDRYRAFLGAIVAEFTAERVRQHWQPLDSPCAADIRVSLPRAWDTSNITKPLFDALELAGIVANDRLIHSYRVTRSAHETKRGHGDIEIWISGGEL